MAEATVTIFVCVSCRRRMDDCDDAFDLPGPGFAEALRSRLQEGGHAQVCVTPVDCLSVCKRPCTIALSGADKWTYLIGDLDPGLHVEEIVATALSFGASGNGIVPWRERPSSFRKGVIARVPPITVQDERQTLIPEPIES